MPLTSLRQLVGHIETQDNWKTRRQFQQLLTCWGQIVGVAVAGHTRPVGIQRQVLHVATSSAVWAQNLAFERMRILQKLNDRLSLDLKDIRFSTAQWRTDGGQSASLSSELRILWQNHPSQVADSITQPVDSVTHPPVINPKAINPQVTHPQVAFQNWAKIVRSRAQTLPLCPRCQSPTPPGELQRWSVCSLCAAQQFGKS